MHFSGQFLRIKSIKESWNRGTNIRNTSPGTRTSTQQMYIYIYSHAKHLNTLVRNSYPLSSARALNMCLLRFYTQQLHIFFNAPLFTFYICITYIFLARWWKAKKKGKKKNIKNDNFVLFLRCSFTFEIIKYRYAHRYVCNLRKTPRLTDWLARNRYFFIPAEDMLFKRKKLFRLMMTVCLDYLLSVLVGWCAMCAHFDLYLSCSSLAGFVRTVHTHFSCIVSILPSTYRFTSWKMHRKSNAKKREKNPPNDTTHKREDNE